MLLTIIKSIGIILTVLVIFNLMIIVHELGHFLAARWRGLVIEKFGIWFGKPLWKKTINGVEYSLGCIPAGGFVALPQLAPMEVMEGKVETPREQLPPISALDKIIVAFAGPLFSFGLACVFAVIVWQVGRPVGEAESSTVVGYVVDKSPAALAGVEVGDKILAVDGHPVTRFSGMGSDSVMWRIVRSEGKVIDLTIDRGGKTLTLQPEAMIPEKTHWWNRKSLRQIGVVPYVSAVVAKVLPDSAAATAGLLPGDLILAVNQVKLASGPEGIYDFAQAHPSTPLVLTVQRQGANLDLPFDPTGVGVVSVEKNSPASTAGLQKGDLILAMDGEKVPVVASLIAYVGNHDGVPIRLSVRRNGAPIEITVTPEVPVSTPDPLKRAKIGFVPEEGDGLLFQQMGRYTLAHPSPIEQLRAGMMSIVNTVDAVISRKSSVSVQHMGGPVMMMNAYYNMLSNPEGIRMALWFSVVLNVNLAMLNMLPIPVLDGGHITLAIIEAIRRKPVNIRILEFVQTGCALVIITFMIFIAFFDVQDLPFLGGKSSQMKFKPAPAANQK